MLSSADILGVLRTRQIGRALHVVDTIDSTNACARNLAEAGAVEGTVVIADHQTAGRGRLGREWTDESGENLLCSVILRPAVPSQRVPLLTFVAAVAVSEAVERVTGVRPDCKWPNDLLIRGRKFSGILLESASSSMRSAYAVIGIGINVNQTSFPPSFSGQATSLAIEAKHRVDRTRLLCAMLESLETWYGPASADDFSAALERWRSQASMFGQQVTVTVGQDRFSGTAVALAEDGGLVVGNQGILRTVYAGDVTLSRVADGQD